MWTIFTLTLGFLMAVNSEAPIQSNYISYPPSSNQQQGYNYDVPRVEVNLAKANTAPITSYQAPGAQYLQPAAPSQVQLTGQISFQRQQQPQQILPKLSSSEYQYNTPALRTTPVRQPQQVYQQLAPVQASYQQPQVQYSQPQQSYTQPQQFYSQPQQQYSQPQITYSRPQVQYQQPSPLYQQPQKLYQAPQQTYQLPQKLYVQPQSIYQQPAAQYITPQPKQVQNSNGYHYSAPQQPFNGQLAPSPAKNPNFDAEVLEPLAQFKQVQPLTLEKYRQPSFSQNSQSYFIQNNDLDSGLMSQIANVLQEHENYARNSLGSYQKVSGITLDQPSRSIEISSFVQNAPLTAPSIFANQRETSTGYDSNSQQINSVSAPNEQNGLPEVVQNRQVQSISSANALAVSSAQSGNYNSVSTPKDEYGLPANRQVQSSASSASATI